LTTFTIPEPDQQVEFFHRLMQIRDVELAKKESPTTDRFYHIDLIADGTSEEFKDFRENLLSRVGIVQ
jgi:hypothetical protein